MKQDQISYSSATQDVIHQQWENKIGTLSAVELAAEVKRRKCDAESIRREMLDEQKRREGGSYYFDDDTLFHYHDRGLVHSLLKMDDEGRTECMLGALKEINEDEMDPMEKKIDFGYVQTKQCKIDKKSSDFMGPFDSRLDGSQKGEVWIRRRATVAARDLACEIKWNKEKESAGHIIDEDGFIISSESSIPLYSRSFMGERTFPSSKLQWQKC